MIFLLLLLVYSILDTDMSTLGISNKSNSSTASSTSAVASDGSKSSVSKENTSASNTSGKEVSEASSNASGNDSSIWIIVCSVVTGCLLIFIIVLYTLKKRNRNRLSKLVEFGDQSMDWKNVETTDRAKSTYSEKSHYGESVFQSKIFDLNSVYMRSDSSLGYF
eukprot:NODE_166_length_16344_cov_0.418775.p8 type:complete len:164 gc:universal NODE_166_length_16344_cov_0.418775:11127-11618(+)